MNIVSGAIHVHSDYSHDGHDSLEQLRDACVARGIRWVGMTDHAEDLTAEVYEEFKQHCVSLSGEAVHFIPGLEFRFPGLRGVHLFALDLKVWMKPQTPEEFFDVTDEHAGLTVLAHPVLCKYTAPQVVLDRIDAIEVWNPNYNTRYLPDPRAIDLFRLVHAKRAGVVATVGLDQHDSSNDREVRIMVSRQNASDPISAIKRGDFTNIGRKMRFDSHATMSPKEMRILRRKRRVLDIVNSAHDRVIRSLRRMGVDP